MDWVALFTSFDGRISRQTFWLGLLALLAVEIAVFSITESIDGGRLGAIIDLAFVYPECALFIKRAQDRGSGPRLILVFFALGIFLDFLLITGLGGTLPARWADPEGGPSMLFTLVLVPWMVMAFALLFDLGFRVGTRGPNHFGPDPLQTGARQ